MKIPPCASCKGPKTVYDHIRRVIELRCSQSCGTPSIELNRAYEALERKPYTSPVITTYGTVRDITKAVAVTGMLDGSPAGFMLKTGASV